MGIGLSDEIIFFYFSGISVFLSFLFVGSKLLEPRLELGKVLAGQTGNGKLKVFDAHGERKLLDEHSFGKKH